jgi:hypothetical protein
MIGYTAICRSLYYRSKSDPVASKGIIGTYRSSYPSLPLLNILSYSFTRDKTMCGYKITSTMLVECFLDVGLRWQNFQICSGSYLLLFLRVNCYCCCFRPYLAIVLSICSTSSGPSFFRTNFPIEITSRISPLWSHTAFPIT